MSTQRTETFASEIETMAGDERIEAIVIGGFGWGDFDDEPGEAYGEDRVERKAPVRRGVVLTWRQAIPMLDYEYSRGFGAPDCDAIWAWTASRVIFVSQYDGSTSLHSVPRNPGSGKPGMPGG